MVNGCDFSVTKYTLIEVKRFFGISLKEKIGRDVHRKAFPAK